MHRQRDEQGGAAVEVDAVRTVPANAQVAGALELLLSDAVLQKRIRVVERQRQARAEDADLDEAFGSAIGVLLDTALHVDLLRQQARLRRASEISVFGSLAGRATSQSEREASGDRFAHAGRVPDLEVAARAQDQRETAQQIALGRHVEERVVEPEEGDARFDLALDDGREAEAAIGSARPTWGARRTPRSRA